MMIRGRHASDRRPGGRAVSKWRRADVYLDGFYGITRHLFIDVAVPDPCGATSRAAGSATRSGVAAAAKEQIKNNKYIPLARRCNEVASTRR